jgi:2-iminoacetate synthase ThiH
VRRKRQERAKLALQILGRLTIGAVLFGVGVGEEESSAAAIGAILIAGSSIPVWIRARTGQLGIGSAVGFEERVATMEQRHRAQMEELAQMQADQVADLEERVDFAERLLAKQRDQIKP